MSSVSTAGTAPTTPGTSPGQAAEPAKTEPDAPPAGAFDAAAVYRDLHANPELGFEEHRTSGIAAEHLAAAGFTVATGIGGTGVVGTLDRGDGPVVLLRADMDALPVEEATGLDYASTATTLDASGTSRPLMHACGHDVHTTCLLGAAYSLAADPGWTGRVIAVFQPAEELGRGARAMVADGLFDRFGTPDVVLGQHVAPLPAGVLGVHDGPAFAASDSLRVTLHGKGGHGSRPETTHDPVLMAASFVVRLQSIVSRVIGGSDVAVVSVGSLHAGTAPNIIPDHATLELTVRTFDPAVRETVLATIERYARAEALAAGSDREPTVEPIESFPAVVNDPDACGILRGAFADLPGVMVVDPGVVTGSEDVGILARESGAPCAYWLLGGSDPRHFAGASTIEEVAAVVAGLPSNHSPHFAPVTDPTLRVGVAALTAAARRWLG
ncbi:amidohydrolase [Nostocoides sp. F2B08]|uniref:amidohydrolase n=1 Tax=Nostocoides sp. F2B08 TaxID=2653936 RepID=UPI0012639B93|nr:amidohydrolase [Tetrasphaera sp. F2B08]KAB7744658.1 amidohydrolase [Tetrasphaera sp. F2B08]